MSSYYDTFSYYLYVERVGYPMADVKETLLTAEGLKKLEEELAYYKSVRRIEVSERIKICY